jgi:CRISPR-associated protein Cas2
MMVVVSYDVSVTTPAGRRRLRRVARLCESYGQRVQNSVFQCLLPSDKWVMVRATLLRIHEPDEDSLRFYFLGKNWRSRVEHHGAKSVVDLDEPLIK